MSKELFIALSGGIAYQRQLEIASNNIANVSTVGFKQDRPVFSVAHPDFTSQGREQPAVGTPSNLLAHSYVAAAEGFIDFRGGTLRHTGNNLDMSLQSEGFFVVEGQNGTPQYTRDGQFRTLKDGSLVTLDGKPVLGVGGPIKITGTDVRINNAGQISVDGQLVDTLRIETFADPGSLSKMGNNLFAATTPGTQATDPLVIQGAIESSNVDPIRGVIDLISVERNFESFTRVVTAIDDLDKKGNSRIKL